MLKIGNGEAPVYDSGFPRDFCNCPNSLEELIDSTYPNLRSKYLDRDWLAQRAILAPLNETVDEINSDIQNRLVPGNEKIFLSINKTQDEEEAVNFSSEVLESFHPANFPPHILRLKVGSPIVLLRNLDPPRLCNGIRLTVKFMTNNVIKAIILVSIKGGPYSYREYP